MSKTDVGNLVLVASLVWVLWGIARDRRALRAKYGRTTVEPLTWSHE